MLDRLKLFEVPANPDVLEYGETYLDLYVEEGQAQAVAGVALPVGEDYWLEMWFGDLHEVVAAIFELLKYCDIAYVPSAEIQVWLDESPCPVVNLSDLIRESGIRKSGDPGRHVVVRDVLAGWIGMASLQVGRSLMQMLLAVEAIHESVVEAAQDYLLDDDWIWVDAIVTHYKGQWLLRPDGTYQVRIRGDSDVAEALMYELGDELLDAQDDKGELLLVFGQQ